VGDLRAVENLGGRVRGPVVGEDDLGRDIAVAQELGALREARLDEASLVIGR
jgi:hypothetical protein